MPRRSRTFACAIADLYASTLRKKSLSTAITFFRFMVTGARTIPLRYVRFDGERLSAVFANLLVHGAFQIALHIPPTEITALIAEMLLPLAFRLRHNSAAKPAAHNGLFLCLAAEMALYRADRESRYIRNLGERQSVLTTRLNLLFL